MCKHEAKKLFIAQFLQKYTSLEVKEITIVNKLSEEIERNKYSIILKTRLFKHTDICRLLETKEDSSALRAPKTVHRSLRDPTGLHAKNSQEVFLRFQDVYWRSR